MMRSQFKLSQKRKYLRTGVFLSLASGGTFGGALALATNTPWVGLVIGVVFSIFCASLYFSEPPV